jgi:signal transduction histidine kinase
MSREHTNRSKPRVLVVDDEPENRALLRDILEDDGYEVTEAQGGMEAVRIVGENPPSVVLLDIMMPGIDGLEVCRSLKANDQTAHIPVILVTAQRQREERLAGIDAGANDFVSKPVDITDLRLRVRNAAKTQVLYEQLQGEYRKVQELESMRDRLTQMIVHDLRSPLSVIGMNLDMALMNTERMFDDVEMQGLHDAKNMTDKMSQMVSTMLDLNRLEANAMPIRRESTDLVELVSNTVPALGVGDSPVYIDIPGTASSDFVSCDSELIRRVLINLVSNAVDFSPKGNPVTVGIERFDGGHRIKVTDRGPGIAPEDQQRVFEKFSTLDSGPRRRKASSGIGLAFCKLAVESHGGSIGVDSEVGRGSTFWFELPR